MLKLIGTVSIYTINHGTFYYYILFLLYMVIHNFITNFHLFFYTLQKHKENICCLNTALLVLVLAHQKQSLQTLLGRFVFLKKISI